MIRHKRVRCAWGTWPQRCCCLLLPPPPRGGGVSTRSRPAAAHVCARCTDKIVTGSLHGMLRVYFPRQNEYRIEDLVLEAQLDAPILQLLAGKFVS